MSKRAGVSVLERIWTNFKHSLFSPKRKNTFVGEDQFGNKYYEQEADPKHNLRGSRYVDENSRKDLQAHDHVEVPIEWESWLRGRRKEPPTPEEIEKNYQRMMQVKVKAARIEGKQTELKASESQLNEGPGSDIAADIHANTDSAAFPKYEEYEAVPGSKYEHDRTKVEKKPGTD